MIKSNGIFEWIDNSNTDFNNWAEDSPSNQTDHNCVQMSSEENNYSKWFDKVCRRRSLAVCQKMPTTSIPTLQKTLFETRKQLNEITLNFNSYLNNLFSDKWINFELFTDTDGKHKAFFIPLNKLNPMITYNWDEANKKCAELNATLVEIQTSEKQFIFESYLGHLGLKSNELNSFILNGRRDSSGIWKWVTSGKELTFNNWAPNYPSNANGYDYIYMHFFSSDLGKWYTTNIEGYLYLVCEIDVDF